MATFVSLSDDDPAIELLRLLDLILNPAVDETKETEASTEKKETTKLGRLQKLAQKKSYSELIEKGLFAYSKEIFASSEDEIEAVFTVVFALLDTVLEKSRNKASGLEAHKQLVLDIADLLSKDPSSASSLKLKLLSLLFNILDEGWAVRYDVLLSLVNFTRASQQSALLVGAFKPLDNWVQLWGLTLEQKRALFLAICGAMTECKSTEYQAEFRSRYLATIDDSCTPEEVAAAADLATEEVRGALNKSAQASVDVDSVLNLVAVQAIKKSKKTDQKLLVELLCIFSKGSISEYQKFAATNPKFLKEEGFVASEQLQLMRTLALCDMGLVQETVSYSKVQQALGLTSSEEVEEAVIQAVVSGRLQAKLDQEEEQVLIESSTKRGFSLQDWHHLGKRLETWRASVSDVIASLQHSGPRPIVTLER
eukprot:gb/GEZN01005823.1/.p1 GENE.gb/GEZN01005823.1/~~gb/GEZN01005823.1/.p1  ORF type:complete len:473 (+),score=90.27 gb/GEZN01005823.1/:150-1421(+)